MALTSHDDIPTEVLDGAVKEYSRDKVYVLTALVPRRRHGGRGAHLRRAGLPGLVGRAAGPGAHGVDGGQVLHRRLRLHLPPLRQAAAHPGLLHRRGSQALEHAVWRSNPVAMARSTTRAVDMTASAIIPGTRKSIGRRRAGGQHVDQREEDQEHHGDAEGEQHRLAPSRASAPARCGSGRPRPAHRRPGAGGRVDWSTATAGTSPVIGRQPQEHVLEALAPGAQVGQGQVVLGQPAR